jgi:MFS family permease
MVNDSEVAEETGSGAGFSTRAWLTLLVLCAAQFMVALDFSIVTVALPAIGEDLDFGSPADLQWVMTACILPTATLLLLFGRASDLVGRRRLFMLGLALLTGFSLLASLANSPGLLIAARAGQGFSSAMVGPTALALLTTTFEEGPRRDKALGVSGALLSLGFIVGTIGGGVVTSALNWRANMFILMGMGIVILIGAALLLPKDGPRSRTRLDIGGAFLATAGLVAIVYAISGGSEQGWGSPVTLGVLALGFVLLLAFLWVEGRTASPLTPLDILRRPSVKWGGLTGFITFGMTGGTTILLSLYMQDVLGWEPVTTGIGLLGEGIAAMVAGFIASKVIARIGQPATLIGGLVVQAVGILPMVLLPRDGNLAILLVTSSLLGLGHVLAVVAFIGTMTSGLPSDSQGMAGGLAQTAQQVGSAIGVAGLTAVEVAFINPPNSTEPGPVLGGLHASFVVSAAVVALGAVIALVFLRHPADAAEEGDAGDEPGPADQAESAGRADATEPADPTGREPQTAPAGSQAGATASS